MRHWDSRRKDRGNRLGYRWSAVAIGRKLLYHRSPEGARRGRTVSWRFSAVTAPNHSISLLVAVDQVIGVRVLPGKLLAGFDCHGDERLHGQDGANRPQGNIR